jgi:hypothetical protein
MIQCGLIVGPCHAVDASHRRAQRPKSRIMPVDTSRHTPYYQWFPLWPPGRQGIDFAAGFLVESQWAKTSWDAEPLCSRSHQTSGLFVAEVARLRVA